MDETEMKMANTPSKQTVEKVAAGLGAVPRTTANLANGVNLSPATCRKALVVLVEQGRAAKNGSGEWVAPAPEPQPQPIQEPAALTKSALGKLSRDDLVTWANSCSLLEHLTEDDIAALSTKGKVVAEVTGALLRVEVAEDHRAAATDEVARPVAELIGFTPAVKEHGAAFQTDAGREAGRRSRAKKAAATKKAAARPEAPASPLTGLAAKLAALGLSDKLARRGGALVELVASEGPLTEAQCTAKLGPLSSWDFRRLVAGEHAGQRFEPLLKAEGKGRERKYSAIG